MFDVDAALSGDPCSRLCASRLCSQAPGTRASGSCAPALVPGPCSCALCPRLLCLQAFAPGSRSQAVSQALLPLLRPQVPGSVPVFQVCAFTLCPVFVSLRPAPVFPGWCSLFQCPDQGCCDLCFQFCVYGALVLCSGSMPGVKDHAQISL
jgi:hypothetical protein